MIDRLLKVILLLPTVALIALCAVLMPIYYIITGEGRHFIDYVKEFYESIN